MNTVQNERCITQASRVVPVLVWSGLGFCAAAATIYDLRDLFSW